MKMCDLFIFKIVVNLFLVIVVNIIYCDYVIVIYSLSVFVMMKEFVNL